MHGLEFFYKDILTADVVFDIPAYLQTLDTSALPFFRSISYLRKDNPRYSAFEASPYAGAIPPLSVNGTILSTSIARSFLKIITPDDILDEYMAEKSDVVYQAGGTIFIRSSTSLQFVNAGWYAWPNLDMANANVGYASWIANEYPYAIIYDAASAVLQKIGMTDAARKYDYQTPEGIQTGLVASHVMNLRNANITAGGG